MTRRTKVLFAALVPATGALVLAAAFFFPQQQGVTITGSVVDDLSGDPIPGVRIAIDGKSTILFRTAEFEFRGIPPGRTPIHISPPAGWRAITEERVLDSNTELTWALPGVGIPDLENILCFATVSGKEVIVEIWFMDSAGKTITVYPRLPISVDAVIWARREEGNGYARGRQLYRGPMETFWDHEAELAKNKAVVPWQPIAAQLEAGGTMIADISVRLPQGEHSYRIDEVSASTTDEGDATLE